MNKKQALYSETLLSLSSENLQGVLCQPTSPDILHHGVAKEPKVQNLCVVFLNAGLIPRSGPFRLHVYLARTLAQYGVNSFRFDLSGIGDSSFGKACSIKDKKTDPILQQAQHEVMLVITQLRQQLPQCRIILFGICAGADLAQRTLFADPTLQGAILIDGHCYPTRRYRWQRIKGLFGNQDRIKALVKRYFIQGCFLFLNSLAGFEKTKMLTKVSSELLNPTLPPKSLVAMHLKSFLENRQKVLVIFTGGVPGYSYQGQFVEAFSHLSLESIMRESYHQQWDHLISVKQDQQDFFIVILQWLQYLSEESDQNGD